MTAALAAVSLPRAAVATAVLACRLVSFWAVVAGGWVVFFFLRRQDRLSRKAQEGLPLAGPELPPVGIRGLSAIRSAQSAPACVKGFAQWTMS